jgi:hypothetical protein
MNEEYIKRFESAAEYVGVWTCNNPNANHTMGREREPSIGQMVGKYMVHDHDNCVECTAYGVYHEGSLDMVVPLDADGNQVTEAMDGADFATEYGMTEY